MFLNDWRQRRPSVAGVVGGRRPKKRQPSRGHRPPPRLEVLEDRTMPSVVFDPVFGVETATHAALYSAEQPDSIFDILGEKRHFSLTLPAWRRVQP
jgi:hypothetical protein